MTVPGHFTVATWNGRHGYILSIVLSIVRKRPQWYVSTFLFDFLQDDPLQKILTAFASKLDVSISKLKFSFDGDDINPSQTAQDLDMENDDCIDVIVMKA